MRITCTIDGVEHSVENENCRGGCMCHNLDMVHGVDPNWCEGCGCPKTLKAFKEFMIREIHTL